MNESRFDEKCIRIPAPISPLYSSQAEENSFIFAMQMELHLKTSFINLPPLSLLHSSRCPFIAFLCVS